MDVERVTDVRVETDIPPTKGGENGHVTVDTNGTQVDGHGIDLFVSGRAEDSWAKPGTMEGRFDRVTANHCTMVFEFQNIDCKITGVGVKSLSGTTTCGDDPILDGNPGGAFGCIDNDICRGRI